MRKVAFYVQKGGTGKTTLSGNTAHVLARDRRTVLIDCDPQGNLSSWFLKTTPAHELADVLTGKVTAAEALVEISPRLSIIPTFGIDGVLKQYAEGPLNDEPFIFEDLCKALEGLGFQVAIFDLSPGMSRLERSVLLAMDETISPVEPEGFSIDGLSILTNELRKINKNYRRNVAHRRIVCNNLNRSFARHLTFLSTLQGMDYQLFTVPQDAKIAEAQVHNLSVFDYFPESRAGAEIERLAAAVAGGAA